MSRSRNRTIDAHYHPSALPSLAPFLWKYWHHSRRKRHARIAIDDRDLRAGEARLLVAINEAKMRLRAQALNRAAHGKQARAKRERGNRL